MRYVISYDLLAPGRDYTTLTNELRELRAQRILLSQWVVRRINTDAANLRDYLRRFIDSNDRILVTCLDSNDWAGWNLMVDPNTV